MSGFRRVGTGMSLRLRLDLSSAPPGIGGSEPAVTRNLYVSPVHTGPAFQETKHFGSGDPSVIFRNPQSGNLGLWIMPKPWDAPGWPWDDYFNRFYSMAALLLTNCSIAIPKPPEPQLLAGIAHRLRTKHRLNWVYPWRKVTRKRNILQLISAANR